MPADINPFEPWRPQPGPDEPRRDVESTRREPEPEWYRQPHAPEPAWTPRREGQGGNAGFVWLSIALVVAALITWAVNGGSHVTRVGAAFLAVWLGLLLAWPVGRGWRWYTRLGLLAAGLAGTVACWLWVPTTGGINLWRAQAVLERTRNLPRGDLAAFSAGAAERNEVSREFSRLRSDIKFAERNWYAGTIRDEVNAADKERVRDPAAAQARLKKLEGVLVGSEHYNTFYQTLHQARRAAMESRLDRLGADLEAQTKRGQFGAAARQARAALQELLPEARSLGMEPDLTSKVRNIRDRNLRAQLAAASSALKQLINAAKYAQVAEDGRRLTADLLPEARELNLQGEVDGELLPLRREAIRQRIHRAWEALEELVKKGNYEAVPLRAQQFEKELDGEARLLNVSPPRLQFLPPRRTALANRANRAVKVLEELLDKKEYAAVASRGAELMRELEPEALASGAPASWAAGLRAARRRALQARLDQARSEARALLKGGRYQAMCEAAEKAFAALSPEAETVGLSKELEKFRDLCRVYARLARQGKVADKKPAGDR